MIAECIGDADRMTAPNFWEVLDRACNTGAITNVKEFDMKIFKVASRLVKEFDIRYDPEIFVPSDDSLADDVWKAGLELFNDIGMYCLSSGRVIKFDESEVKEALREVRGEVEIGEGGERRVVTRTRNARCGHNDCVANQTSPVARIQMGSPRKCSGRQADGDLEKQQTARRRGWKTGSADR